MPATAGRVRMPANNCVHSSAALQTHGIWQSAIGYDPYAPENSKHQGPYSSIAANAAAANEGAAPPSSDPATSSVNAYTSFQGLLDIARLSSNPDETRGACKKCGRVGHLTFQCRNFLSVKTIGLEDDILQASNEAEAQAEFAETKNKASGGRDADEEGSEEDDVDNDSSDSDIDPMLEKIIAEREHGKSNWGKQSEENNKKASRHRSSSSRGRLKHRRSDSEDDTEERTKNMKKKDRRKKHESSGQDRESDSDRKSRKRQRTHRRKDDESGGEGRRHRRHHKRHHHRRDAPDSDGDRAPI